jgi:hypothetical protein
MNWEDPSFSDIKMDAEISSYQDDFNPTRDPAFASGAGEAWGVQGAEVSEE